MGKPRIVVYTAIFGRDDKLREPLVAQSPNVQLIAYMLPGEGPPATSAWGVRPPVWSAMDTMRRLARRHKTQAHALFPDADYTLWLDGSMQLKTDVATMVPGKLKEHIDICWFRHSQRRCVYREAAACIRLQKDKSDVIRAQMANYRSSGYPEEHGLFETGILLRRNTSNVAKFEEAWWGEISRGSSRDQLSANYACWRLQLPYATFDGTVYDNPYANFYPHGRNKPIKGWNTP